MDVDQAVGCLRAAGRRITGERVAVLQAMADHPHADAAELYRVARGLRPQISLSTVYRTVNLLRDLGMAEASGLGEGHRHFETRGDSHYHCVCVRCGRVLEVAPVPEVRERVERLGFRVSTETVEITGYCAACAEGRLATASTGDASPGERKVIPAHSTSDEASEIVVHALSAIPAGQELVVEARGVDAESVIAEGVRAVGGVRLARLVRRQDRVLATLVRVDKRERA